MTNRSSGVPDYGRLNAAARIERERLEAAAPELLALAMKLEEVVLDFLPNAKHCVLQDFGRLNTGLLEASAMRARFGLPPANGRKQ